MKIEIAKQDDRMAPSGAAILRSLQNESLPVIDLVIRESFQNSLDAKLPKKDYVHINSQTDKIKTKKVSHYFEGITDNLNKNLSEDTTVLSISDTNTSGLTGEFNPDDPKELEDSNIHKLIYGINMNQEKGDAGGSWGLGKTSFFRIGTGIVIYYSRIQKTDGSFEERLAACLIEDSGKKNAIMPENSRGIAWWGEKSDDLDEFEKTYPITDEKFIKQFLNDFRVKRYDKDKTGTTIIMPFINEKELTAKKDDHTIEREVYWWEDDFNETLKIAIKRWYSPRLLNDNYKEKFNHPFLVSTLNEQAISITKSDKTYYLFSELYNAALTKKTNNELINFKDIYLKSLGMKSTSIPAGVIAYTKVSAKDLNITNGSGLSPLAYIGDLNISNKTGAKILAYSRKPGMIIEYVVDDNEWMNGVPVEEDEFVFAFFVPNSDGRLHERYQTKFKILENYLRATENADHANWDDIYIDNQPVTIIKRLKNEVSKALATELGESLETISSRRTSTLSRKYGQLFMPETNFGKSGSLPKKPGTDKGEEPVKPRRTKKASVTVDDYKTVAEDTIKIFATITIPEYNQYDLSVDVKTTDKILNIDDWFKTFDNKIPYPFRISNMKFISGERIEISNNKNKQGLFEYKFINDSHKLIESKISFFLNVKDPTMQPSISLINKEDIK